MSVKVDKILGVMRERDADPALMAWSQTEYAAGAIGSELSIDVANGANQMAASGAGDFTIVAANITNLIAYGSVTITLDLSAGGIPSDISDWLYEDGFTVAEFSAANGAIINLKYKHNAYFMFVALIF